MKRLLLVVSIGISCLMAGQGIRAETIKMGYFVHPPHQYLTDSGELRGATIVYFEMAAAQMGVEVEWVGPLPIIRITNYLKDGTIDGLAHMNKFPGAEEYMYFANEPYHTAQAVFVVRKDYPLKQITSIRDVEGFRVGWLANSPASPFVQENLTHFRMDYLVPTEATGTQLLNKLLLDRVDALHELNAYSLPFAAKKMHVEEHIKVLPLPEPPQPIYVAFSKHSPRGQWLIEQYNAVQQRMPFGDEEYAKLIQLEFDTLSEP